MSISRWNAPITTYPAMPSRADRPSRKTGRPRSAGTTQLLEQLTDHDDNLLEQLLMDQVPEPARSLPTSKRETSDNLGVSVLFGVRSNGWGVRRLLKALRHEAPGPEATTAARLRRRCPTVHAFKICSWRIGWPAGPGRAFRDRSMKIATSKAPATNMAGLVPVFRAGRQNQQDLRSQATATSSPLPGRRRSNPGDWHAQAKLPAADRNQPAASRNCSLAVQPAGPRTTSSCRVPWPAFWRRIRA